MTSIQQASELEATAARMFFNVSVQAAFALEDPNMRFGLEFQHDGARATGKAQTIETVLNNRYETEMDGGTLMFEANPANSPALSRVIVVGANVSRIIDLVLAGFQSAEYFAPTEQQPLEQVGKPPEVMDLGNRMVRLVVSENVATDHDVAALFSWDTGSDKGHALEMLAWPINKTSDLNYGR